MEIHNFFQDFSTRLDITRESEKNHGGKKK